jgi:hypothetical protein
LLLLIVYLHAIRSNQAIAGTTLDDAVPPAGRFTVHIVPMRELLKAGAARLSDFVGFGRDFVGFGRDFVGFGRGDERSGMPDVSCAAGTATCGRPANLSAMPDATSGVGDDSSAVTGVPSARPDAASARADDLPTPAVMRAPDQLRRPRRSISTAAHASAPIAPGSGMTAMKPSALPLRTPKPTIVLPSALMP